MNKPPTSEELAAWRLELREAGKMSRIVPRLQVRLERCMDEINQLQTELQWEKNNRMAEEERGVWPASIAEEEITG